MKPFCGYNFGDYFTHWLKVGAKLKNPPKIFHVNWFRQGSDGKFLWPGFGDNLRVLSWMLDRVAGRAGAKETAIGNLPRPEDLNLAGLDIKSEVVEELLSVKQEAWRKELHDIRQYLAEFGSRTPGQLYSELEEVEERLS